jgi:hypothetical protein
MASLSNQTIGSSFEQLLHVDRDGGGDTTAHVNVKDGDNGTTFGFTIASDALMMTSTNRLEFYDDGLYIYSSADSTLDIVSDGAINLTPTTDVVIPANIGITFGDGEKIEGNDADLTITSGGAINLTATTDVVVPADVGVTFGTGEKIEGNDTDLTVTSGADINLTATSNINVPPNVGITFGDDGENIKGDGTDLTILSGGNLNLRSTVDEADAIYIRANAGASETIRIHSDQGTGASAATESDASIQLLSDLGGIGIRSGLNAVNAIRLETDGGASENIVIHSNQGTSITEGAASIQLLSDAGGINIKSKANLAECILLTADGGADESIKLHADQSTSSSAIELVADAGGIVINAGLDLAFTASGGDVTFNDDAGEIVSFDTSGNITALGDIILNDGGSLKEAGGVAAITFDGSGNVTKIGQGTAGPAQDGYVLSWDNTNGYWKPIAGTELETAASSVPASGISDGSGAVNIYTTTGDITLDTDDGDIYLMADNDSIFLTDGSNTRFEFDLTGATLKATGDFTLDGSGDIVLDADGGDWEFRDGGTDIFTVTNNSTDVDFTINTASKDFVFKENGGTALLRIGEANGVYYAGVAGTSNTVYGKNSAKSIDSNSNENVFIGEDVADATLSSAINNTGVGYSSLSSLTTGDRNVSIGSSSLLSNTTGSDNVGLGFNALKTATSPWSNVAIGSYALEDISGAGATDSNNVAVGYKSMSDVVGGTQNVAIGHHSLKGDSGTTGITNTIAIGTYSGSSYSDSNIINTANLYTGYNNIFIGSFTGFNKEASNTTDGDGYSNICIGYNATCKAVDGDQSQSKLQLALGARMITDAPQQCRIGAEGNYAQLDVSSSPSAWTFASDERLKTNIIETDLGLNLINNLKPVKFNWKENKDNDSVDGFIAQDVKKVLDKLGVTFSGWSEGRDSMKDMDVQRLSYGSFVVPLVKAVQELSARVEHLEANNKTVTHIN